MVRDWDKDARVAGSSPSETLFYSLFKQLAPSSLFNISLVFTYFYSEKARKAIGIYKTN